ncbi:hypothetical protein ACN2EN_07600 [Aliarcobacter lanthieri]|uniref:Secreted protein n=1 Tax=Aliarcobacter butzleri L355 TaxID=1447263 RepID=A0A0G9KRK5_9BACT|nr:hypothetical protein [Aliarcobacter butzleri]KLE09202.1 hypothetical protein AF80_07285 [Aliarcobacter butzleri L355]
MKKIKNIKRFMFLCLFVLLPNVALAHSPFFMCEYDDGKIHCEGGYSDGSSASGVKIKLMNDDGKVLEEKKLDKLSSVSFDKPNSDFYILFDGGTGHSVEVEMGDISGL